MLNKITIAKAIGIICVVVGHSGCPEYMRSFIYLFHMPLFFFISGYCFKEKYLNQFYNFTKQRITGLYFPFIKWTCLFILLHNLFYDLNLYNSEFGVSSGNGTVSYNFKAILWNLMNTIFRFSCHEQLLGVFWFINSLFFGYFVFYLTLKLFKNSIIRLLVLFLGALTILWFNIEIPYIGFRTIYPAFFITLGYIYRIKIEEFIRKTINQQATIIISLLILAIAAFFLKTEMLRVTTLTVLPYTLFAIIGSIFILNISDIFCRNQKYGIQFINYLGNHTFGVMTLHFLAFKLVQLFIIYVCNYPIGMLAAFPVISYYEPNEWWIMYSLVGVICPLLLYFVVDKLQLKLKNSK